MKFSTAWLNSPVLLLALLASSGAVGFTFYRSNRAGDIPDLPHYRLSDKAEVIVICYQPGCGCEKHTLLWTNEMAASKKTVVVLSHQWQADVASMKTNPAFKTARIFMDVPDAVMNYYSPTHTTTISLIRNGQIIQQATGGDALHKVLTSENVEK